MTKSAPVSTAEAHLTSPMAVEIAGNFAAKVPPRQRRARALDLLDRVGIADQADKLPAMLSGGQQQRAAIARALANDPPLILADEPTGNLDSHTAAAMLELFTGLNAEGRTIVVVTHERDIRDVVSREITLVDGRIITDTRLTGASA